ncbi:MAG: glutathione transferase GstA [Pseudomonadota bacterium]
MSIKLYYAPGVCSLSPHIVLNEANIPYTLEKVNLKTKETETGRNYFQISEKGSVPAIELEDGNLLTEGPAIVQYLADQAPGAQLAPPNGTMERARLQEWLNYISTELHKGHGPLFHADKAGEQAKAYYLEQLKNKYTWLDGKLAERDYLMGSQFSVADAYLFTVLRWLSNFNVDLNTWPHLAAYQARIAARPAVQRAMAAEGLLDQQAAA